MKTPIKSFDIIKKIYEYFVEVEKYRDLEPRLMICEKEDFDNVEKYIKAFDITLDTIKRLVEFNVYELQGRYYITTGSNYRGQIPISKEAYDVLREML